MPKRKSGDPIPRPPEDFAKILASDTPLFLVGGQAVNLWALYYHEYTVELTPFVSRDADVLGNRETLSRIARAANVKPQFFPMRPPTNEIGVVVVANTDGEPLPVEVLSSLHGIKNKDLQEPAYTISIGDDDVLVRVPGPIAMLQAKIANVADLNQEGRQDERHVRILAKIMPAYLADLQDSVVDGRINEREMLNLLERLLMIVTSKKAGRVLKKLSISRRAIFAGIKAEKPSKLRSFLTKRLPRFFPDS